MPETFVFLQVGDALEPCILVKSIRRVMPDARIIQCSDGGTARIDGVTEVFRVDGDTTNLMTLRLKAFSELRLQAPAAYMDTDMVVLRPLNLGLLVGAADAVVCERSFGREKPFNHTFRDRDFSFYRDKNLYQAHPYIACFTITKNSEFWEKTYEVLLGLAPIFHYWFGDQEAIKTVVQAETFQIKRVPESTYACLPEEVVSSGNRPRVLHFKGRRRKQLMLKYL
jgi:hypothetical protein